MIANAVKSINYYPEINRKDSTNPFTLYQRPGRRKLAQSDAPARVRGLYQASNGAGYTVIGQNVYYVTPGWELTLLGALTTPAGTPVEFIDNGSQILLVDGSPYGYTIDLSTNTFAVLNDPTGAFTGSTKLATLDTYILFNYPGTRDFGSSLSGVLDFDALYIAAKSAYPDPIIALTVNRRELMLFGRLKTEIWYNIGGTTFPFAILPGAYVEHGCLAPYSVASQDIETFWLSQDLQGAYMVLKIRGYDVSRISNHALEFALQKMANAGADLSQAIGWTWQQGGHVFYTLTFPDGNQTWVYDASLGDDVNFAWHQEAFSADGRNPQRMRDNCGAFLYGQNVVGDHTDGTLYAVDPTVYYDEVGGVQYPIVCVRTFGHFTAGMDAKIGQLAGLDGKRLQVSNFRLDMDCGGSETTDQVIGLRWSWDRGHSYGDTVLQPAGSPGAFKTIPTWTPLGAEGRDPILEVTHQILGPAALQGAWVDVDILNR